MRRSFRASLAARILWNNDTLCLRPRALDGDHTGAANLEALMRLRAKSLCYDVLQGIRHWHEEIIARFLNSKVVESMAAGEFRTFEAR